MIQHPIIRTHSDVTKIEVTSNNVSKAVCMKLWVGEAAVKPEVSIDSDICLTSNFTLQNKQKSEGQTKFRRTKIKVTSE